MLFYKIERNVLKNCTGMLTRILCMCDPMKHCVEKERFITIAAYSGLLL